MIPIAKPSIGLGEIVAVNRVLRSGKLAQGELVQKFESEFSQVLADGRPTIALNSGTSGQHLAMLAFGVGPGDEIIVPSFTFAATANSVALTGATPVFCDISPDSYTLNPDKLESLITDRTKAIMPVHLYGHPAEMARILQIAGKHGLKVFEDAAQAHGASLDGRKVGTFGDFAMFSLYPTKNMTSGEGGMVTVQDKAAELSLRLLRNQGMDRPYENTVIGYNNRMTDIHAAIGRVQLKKLGRFTAKRIQNASFLSAGLRGVGVPSIRVGAKHVFHQFTIRVSEDRDGFAKALLNEHQVSSGVYYPIPCHRLPSLSSFHRGNDLSETDCASREVLSLPVHPGLTKLSLEKIVSGVNRLARAGG